MRYSEEGAVFDIVGGDCESFAGFSPGEARADKTLLQKSIAAEDRALFHELHIAPREVGERVSFVFRFDLGEKTTWGFEKSRVVDVDFQTGVRTYAGAIWDITEKILLRDMVSESATKSHFFAAMNHEIRTPLNAINGVLYMLSQTPLSAQQQNYISILQKGSSTLLETINEILDASKIQAGGVSVIKKAFNIEALLSDIQAIFGTQAMEKKIQFTVCLAENVPRNLFGDGFHIKQMLFNTVGNAFKFTSSGRICVNCELESRVGKELMLKFTVTDTGIGMDQGVLEKVFKPFVQADSDVSQRHKGTGLGLYIVKSLAEMMEGRVDVQSKKGHGSAFLFTCKATEADTPMEEHKRVSDRIPTFLGHVVLLVDDDSINRQIASFLLENTGLMVEEAENGLEAVQMVKKAPKDQYSLILMDVEMPVLNGIQATRKIRSLSAASEIPIIAMTAHAFDREINMFMEAGMNSHISKPFDVQDFYTELSKYLHPPAGMSDVSA